MATTQRPFQIESRSDDDLSEIAKKGGARLIRAWAIDELARRALERPELMADVHAEIGRARSWRELQAGAPIGYMAAGRLLGTNDDEAVKQFLLYLNGWEGQDQLDLLRWWAGPHLAERIEDFGRRFGWEPKFETRR